MFPSFLHGIIKQLILCLMIVSYSELSKRKPIRPTVCTHGDNATMRYTLCDRARCITLLLTLLTEPNIMRTFAHRARVHGE